MTAPKYEQKYEKNGCFYASEKKNNFISHLFFCDDAFERKKKKRGSLLCRETKKRRHVWSDDESAEKADRGEKFVEFDREVRRYLFHTCASEIECD